MVALSCAAGGGEAGEGEGEGAACPGSLVGVAMGGPWSGGRSGGRRGGPLNNTEALCDPSMLLSLSLAPLRNYLFEGREKGYKCTRTFACFVAFRAAVFPSPLLSTSGTSYHLSPILLHLYVFDLFLCFVFECLV